MPVNIAAKLAENATSGALAMAKKPFECVRQVSMVGVNTVSDVGGYHEVSVGAVKFRTGDGGDIPDKKYVDVTANQSTAVADRCVAALMQQSRAGHVATDPLQEAMTVYKVTYPVLSEQIANPGVSTDYVVTSLSLPNVLRVKYEEACPGGCPCQLGPDSDEEMPHEAEDDEQDGAGMGLSSAPAAAPPFRTFVVAPEYPEIDRHIMGPAISRKSRNAWLTRSVTRSFCLATTSVQCRMRSFQTNSGVRLRFLTRSCGPRKGPMICVSSVSSTVSW